MNRSEPLDELIASLRALGAKKATPERRAVMRDALSNKWEGAQSVAAQALGSWGGPESVADLRWWLSRLDHHGSFTGPRVIAMEQLACCIGPEDADWVLDLYFGQESVTATHEYLGLATRVDPAVARTRIMKESRNPNPVRRHAALKLISCFSWRIGQNSQIGRASCRERV